MCVPSKTLHFIYLLLVVDVVLLFFLPARASEQGIVIAVGVHIYIYMCRPKKIESYFSNRLTFLNIRGRILIEYID